MGKRLISHWNFLMALYGTFLLSLEPRWCISADTICYLAILNPSSVPLRPDPPICLALSTMREQNSTCNTGFMNERIVTFVSADWLRLFPPHLFSLRLLHTHQLWPIITSVEPLHQLYLPFSSFFFFFRIICGDCSRMFSRLLILLNGLHLSLSPWACIPCHSRLIIILLRILQLIPNLCCFKFLVLIQAKIASQSLMPRVGNQSS